MIDQDGKIEETEAAGKADFSYQILAFSEDGCRLAVKLEEALQERGLSACAQRSGRPLKAADWTREYFRKGNCLIYIGACGIAVRSIASLLKSKLQDPPVLVLDEKGKFVIPLLSGHLGGANREAERLAAMIGAQAVLTTGTDVHRKFAADSWADSQGLQILEPERIVRVSGKVLDEKAGIIVCSRWEISGDLPDGIGAVSVLQEESGENERKIPEETAVSGIAAEMMENRKNADVIIDVSVFPEERALHLVPEALALGIGCRKETPPEYIEACWKEFSSQYGFSEAALSAAASIDVKKDETGIIEFCKEKKIPFRTYTAEELNALKGDFTGSDFVKKTVGTDNVCERSAVKESGGKYSHLIAEKFSCRGVTMAAALQDVCLKWKQDRRNGRR
ncbi:MAG: cobalt-precorrin 5A hydrolase [Eubacterium sp.]